MSKKSKNQAFDNALSAIYTQNIEKIALEISPEIINSTDSDGRTLLMLAIRLGNLKIVEILISKGSNLNLQDNGGWTALHFASQFYLPDIVELLLRNGAQVDIQDSYGNPPLSKAVFESKGRGEIINLLLNHGADRNLKNNYGISPVILANTIANYDVKQFFLSASAVPTKGK